MTFDTNMEFLNMEVLNYYEQQTACLQDDDIVASKVSNNKKIEYWERSRGDKRVCLYLFVHLDRGRLKAKQVLNFYLRHLLSNHLTQQFTNLRRAKTEPG